MANFDGMDVIFRDDSKISCFSSLSSCHMLPTRYPNQICMEGLGIEASVRYLCHQLSWDEYADDINVTYRNLTLEFLSSLNYETYVRRGDEGGRINFRIFDTEYSFTLKQFGDLLGF